MSDESILNVSGQTSLFCLAFSQPLYSLLFHVRQLMLKWFFISPVPMPELSAAQVIPTLIITGESVDFPRRIWGRRKVSIWILPIDFTKTGFTLRFLISLGFTLPKISAMRSLWICAVLCAVSLARTSSQTAVLESLPIRGILPSWGAGGRFIWSFIPPLSSVLSERCGKFLLNLQVVLQGSLSSEVVTQTGAT